MYFMYYTHMHYTYVCSMHVLQLLFGEERALTLSPPGCCRGPAILDLSAWAVMPMMRGGPRPRLTVNWTGETAEQWEERLKVWAVLSPGTWAPVLGSTVHMPFAGAGLAP